MPRVLKCACGATTATEKTSGDIYCNTCGAKLESEKKSAPTLGVIALTIAATAVFFAVVYAVFMTVPEVHTGDPTWRRMTEESMCTRLILFWTAATQYSMLNKNTYWSNEEFRKNPYKWNIPPDFCFKVIYRADTESGPASKFICVAMPDSVDISEHVYGVNELGVVRLAVVKSQKDINAIRQLIDENRIDWGAPKDKTRLHGPGVPEFTTYTQQE
ncbi:MAG: hypothetical protein WC712_07425 [Candidatus Brocadiia bacterium]